MAGLNVNFLFTGWQGKWALINKEISVNTLVHIRSSAKCFILTIRSVFWYC